MKFKIKETEQPVELCFRPVGDCMYVLANNIYVCGFTEDGRIVTCFLPPENVKILVNLGFQIHENKIVVY
ncbi:hypothetical protein C4565_00370 [Candidatus Parcubacteria bacterium]|nr:MAG: hypothetical protein C4565_00370 [Candidatus Parcubacteria bacterium]